MPFSGVPEIPTKGLVDWQAALFTVFKENIELLTASRGEAGLVSRSLIRGDVTVNQVGAQIMGSVQHISPDGYTISSKDVAALTAHRALRDDVQELANDLYRTRQSLDLLIRNLTGA